jgi:hypothetical protein
MLRYRGALFIDFVEQLNVERIARCRTSALRSPDH